MNLFTRNSPYYHLLKYLLFLLLHPVYAVYLLFWIINWKCTFKMQIPAILKSRFLVPREPSQCPVIYLACVVDKELIIFVVLLGPQCTVHSLFCFFTFVITLTRHYIRVPRRSCERYFTVAYISTSVY